MTVYIGLIRKNPASDYGVDFPDFSGCISAGSSFEEVLSLGKEALEGHVEVMQEIGENIPKPSSLEKIMRNPENGNGIPVLFQLDLNPTGKNPLQRINITLPQSLIERISRDHRNRSAFLAQAAQEKLDRMA